MRSQTLGSTTAVRGKFDLRTQELAPPFGDGQDGDPVGRHDREGLIGAVLFGGSGQFRLDGRQISALGGNYGSGERPRREPGERRFRQAAPAPATVWRRTADATTDPGGMLGGTHLPRRRRKRWLLLPQGHLSRPHGQGATALSGIRAAGPSQ